MISLNLMQDSLIYDHKASENKFKFDSFHLLYSFILILQLSSFCIFLLLYFSWCIKFIIKMSVFWFRLRQTDTKGSRQFSGQTWLLRFSRILCFWTAQTVFDVIFAFLDVWYCMVSFAVSWITLKRYKLQSRNCSISIYKWHICHRTMQKLLQMSEFNNT